jgi:hypothetical protein
MNQQTERNSDYVTLEQKYTTVFREPALIDLVCRSTKQKIRKKKRYRKTDLEDEHRNQGLWWAFATMAGSSPKDLHPPGNQSKMSINAHISMTRWVLEMVENKIAEIGDHLDEGVTYVWEVQQYENKSNPLGQTRGYIRLGAANNVKVERLGHMLLKSERVGWMGYVERLNETLSVLTHLRTVLADGYCDGDRRRMG